MSNVVGEKLLLKYVILSVFKLLACAAAFDLTPDIAIFGKGSVQ